jgi:hypothetical protein
MKTSRNINTKISSYRNDSKIRKGKRKGIRKVGKENFLEFYKGKVILIWISLLKKRSLQQTFI